jgi:hypothetical protein
MANSLEETRSKAAFDLIKQTVEKAGIVLENVDNRPDAGPVVGSIFLRGPMKPVRLHCGYSFDENQNTNLTLNATLSLGFNPPGQALNDVESMADPGFCLAYNAIEDAWSISCDIDFDDPSARGDDLASRLELDDNMSDDLDQDRARKVMDIMLDYYVKLRG